MSLYRQATQKGAGNKKKKKKTLCSQLAEVVIDGTLHTQKKKTVKERHTFPPSSRQTTLLWLENKPRLPLPVCCVQMGFFQQRRTPACDMRANVQPIVLSGVV